MSSVAQKTQAVEFLAEAGAHFVLAGADKRAKAKAWQKTPAPLKAVEAHMGGDPGYVGVIPASLGLVCVDCDKGGAGVESAKDLLGPPLLENATKTPGHRHLWYGCSASLGNSTWDGGDIRSGRGYAIVYDWPGLAEAVQRRTGDVAVQLPTLPGATKAPAASPSSLPSSPSSSPAARTNGHKPEEVAGLIIDISRRMDPAKRGEFFEADHDLMGVFNHTCAPKPSSSNYEASISMRMLRDKAEEQDVHDMMAAHRHEWPGEKPKGNWKDYVLRTLATAKAELRTGEGSIFKDLEVSPFQLRKHLPLEGTWAKAEYVIIGKRTVTIGDAEKMRSQSKVLAAIFDATGDTPRHVERKEWPGILKRILQLIEDIPVGHKDHTSTREKQETREWLTTYQSTAYTVEVLEASVFNHLSDKPSKFEGRVLISVAGFKQWIYQQDHEPRPKVEIERRLHGVGWDREQFKVKVDGEPATRGAWTGPMEGGA